MATMTHDEIRAFLAAGTRTGKLATTRANGRPHVAPIWFVPDGDDLVFTTGAGTVKGLALQRDPFAALTVDDDTFPYSFVIVEGSVAISEDIEQLRTWSTKIAERYVPAGRAEAYGERNGVPGELLVRLTPTRVIGGRDVAL